MYEKPTTKLLRSRTSLDAVAATMSPVAQTLPTAGTINSTFWPSLSTGVELDPTWVVVWWEHMPGPPSAPWTAKGRWAGEVLSRVAQGTRDPLHRPSPSSAPPPPPMLLPPQQLALGTSGATRTKVCHDAAAGNPRHVQGTTNKATAKASFEQKAQGQRPNLQTNATCERPDVSLGEAGTIRGEVWDAGRSVQSCYSSTAELTALLRRLGLCERCLPLLEDEAIDELWLLAVMGEHLAEILVDVGFTTADAETLARAIKDADAQDYYCHLPVHEPLASPPLSPSLPSPWPTTFVSTPSHVAPPRCTWLVTHASS